MIGRGNPGVSGPESGLWHLVSADADEQAPPPQHRVDVRLNLSDVPCRAFVVNRHTNEEMLPSAVTEFDGTTLRLGQPWRNAGPERPRLWFQMEWDGVRFSGNLVDEKGNPLPGSPRMKLIRAS